MITIYLCYKYIILWSGQGGNKPGFSNSGWRFAAKAAWYTILRIRLWRRVQSPPQQQTNAWWIWLDLGGSGWIWVALGWSGWIWVGLGGSGWIWVEIHWNLWKTKRFFGNLWKFPIFLWFTIHFYRFPKISKKTYGFPKFPKISKDFQKKLWISKISNVFNHFHTCPMAPPVPSC